MSTATKIENPAKRGDLVVWLETHNDYIIGQGQQKREHWHVGIVAKASREGHVKKVCRNKDMFIRGGHDLPSWSSHVMVLPLDKSEQSAAWVCVERAIGRGQDYHANDVKAARESLEGMRAFVRSFLRA